MKLIHAKTGKIANWGDVVVLNDPDHSIYAGRIRGWQEPDPTRDGHPGTVWIAAYRASEPSDELDAQVMAPEDCGLTFKVMPEMKSGYALFHNNKQVSVVHPFKWMVMYLSYFHKDAIVARMLEEGDMSYPSESVLADGWEIRQVDGK